jgi:uncharacterized protein (TIGR02466 family)
MTGIVELFATPVYKTTVNISETNFGFVNKSRETVMKNSYGNNSSSDTFILNKPEMDGLREQVNSALQYYADSILGVDGVKLEITQSWINYNDPETSHHTHTHPNSIVSGVIYFSDEPSDIVFFRPSPVTNLKPRIKTRTKFNELNFYMPVSKCTMILFPSTTSHGVNINKTNDTRISLAFNTFYSGTLGGVEYVDYLEIK